MTYKLDHRPTRALRRRCRRRVGLRQVDQGNYVTTGDTNGVVVITQLQPISADLHETSPGRNLTAIMKPMRAGDEDSR